LTVRSWNGYGAAMAGVDSQADRLDLAKRFGATPINAAMGDPAEQRRCPAGVSHEIGLDEAPGADEKFDRRVDGYTKVLLHP
jgi:hypothetical protein